MPPKQATPDPDSGNLPAVSLEAMQRMMSDLFASQLVSFRNDFEALLHDQIRNVVQPGFDEVRADLQAEIVNIRKEVAAAVPASDKVTVAASSDTAEHVAKDAPPKMGRVVSPRNDAIRDYFTANRASTAPDVKLPPKLHTRDEADPRSPTHHPEVPKDELEVYVKRAWPKVLGYNDLQDHQSRSNKAAQTRYDKDAPVLSRWSDPLIWDKLTQIQDILVTDLSPYYLWPTRCLPSFKDDFETIVLWTRETQPNWISFIHKVLDEIGPAHHARTTTIALSVFHRQIKEGDSPGDIARKLRKVTLQVPDLWASANATRELARTHLEEHLPEVAAAMSRDHRSKEGNLRIWLDAMVRSADEEENIHSKKTRAVASYADVAAPVMETVLATNQEGECYNCGKKGHWSRDCRAPRKDRKPERKEPGPEARKAFVRTWRKHFSNDNKQRSGRRPQQQRTYEVHTKEDEEEDTDDEYDELNEKMRDFMDELDRQDISPELNSKQTTYVTTSYQEGPIWKPSDTEKNKDKNTNEKNEKIKKNEKNKN